MFGEQQQKHFFLIVTTKNKENPKFYYSTYMLKLSLSFDKIHNSC